jgi:hypothetical protein
VTIDSTEPEESPGSPLSRAGDRAESEEQGLPESEQDAPESSSAEQNEQEQQHNEEVKGGEEHHLL